MAMESKDFAELVRESRSCRRFDESKPVGMRQLRDLIEVVRFAPTGNNTQLLRFHLSTEPQEVKMIFSHHRWAGLLPDWDGPEQGARPTAYIVVCGPSGASKAPIRSLDAGIAAQTIMLAAHAAGIAGCMIASFDGGLADELGLSAQGLAPLIVLALGVAAPDEKIVIEDAGGEHGVRYWRELDAHTQHVPKRSLDELLV